MNNFTSIKTIVFLLPEAPWNRLGEDGLIQSLEVYGIISRVMRWSKKLNTVAQQQCEQITNIKDIAGVIYPAFNCDIFDWEGSAMNWFFGYEQGTKILHSPRPYENIIGAAEFIKMLQSEGLRTIPMDFHYGSPADDFELTFYGDPSDVANEINNKLI